MRIIASVLACVPSKGHDAAALRNPDEADKNF
jgi:hypothetical protein